jgi:hypothetical protein
VAVAGDQLLWNYRDCTSLQGDLGHRTGEVHVRMCLQTMVPLNRRVRPRLRRDFGQQVKEVEAEILAARAAKMDAEAARLRAQNNARVTKEVCSAFGNTLRCASLVATGARLFAFSASLSGPLGAEP